MNYFRVRNFEQFQHYKHRNPPWIRLYYMILHDLRFYSLDNSTKYLAIGCFLLASQHENEIPFDERWIVKELSFEGTPNWQALLDSEFIVPIDCDASALLARGLQDASQSITDSSDSTETEILSFSPKTAKRRTQEVHRIFNAWNTAPGVMHHRAVNGQEKAIITCLKKYSPEEIILAIERYSLVRDNSLGKYREVYAWTLGEFLSRQNGYNLERFTSETWEMPFLTTNLLTAKNAPYHRDTLGLDTSGNSCDGCQFKGQSADSSECAACIERHSL